MKRAFIKGNDAVVAGALYAGCRAFFGYPITPASELAHDMMKRLPEAGGMAIQAESEVAAINMVYGAASTGAAVMTATSGPGFSLMQEGMSYLAAARLPCVIVDVMRSGPGLGNIGPEQGDYWMAVKGGGHGDYRMPVLAPASVSEMFWLTARAFEIAFKYRTPVVVLADAFIGQMMETIDLPDDLPDETGVPAVRWPFDKAVHGDAETFGRIVSTLELVPQRLNTQNDARFADYDKMAAELCDSETDTCDNAETLVVSYGICSRIAHEAVRTAREQGLRVSWFRPVSLWPMDADTLQKSARSVRHVCVVECSRGQLREDIERLLAPLENHLEISGVCTDGGIIPTAEQILACWGSAPEHAI